MLDTITGTKGLPIHTNKADQLKKWWKEKQRNLLFEQGGLLYFVAFLLGRAVILESLSPFALAYLASVWFVRKEKVRPLIIVMIIGATTVGIEHGLFIATASFVFVFFAAIVKQVKNQQKIIPFLVFFASLLPRVTHYALFDTLNSFEWTLAIVEAVLSAVLVLIFMQSIPLLSPKRYKPTLKNEEIISLIILLASVLTGTIGWELQGANVEQIASRYLVLWLAYIGGAAIGSTVGVVTGLILSLASVSSLYQMSLLAFGGLLGGLLKEGKKLGVGLGLFVGTVLIGIYGGGIATLFPSLLETSIAILLFFCTPDQWIRQMSRYIPGTNEHTIEQQQYVQKVRDVTANRIEQFSDVFEALSKSFEGQPEKDIEDDHDQKELDYYLSNVTEKTCQSCFKKDWCWGQHFDETYDYMTALKQDLEKGQSPNKITQSKFSNHCVKSQKVVEVMKEELSYYEANQKLKKQVGESRRFVADQLLGVAEVMGDFAKEIVKEKENHEQQELEIIAALKHLGVEIDKLEIYSLKKGDIDIELDFSVYQYNGEGPKLIAPVISDILEETIVIKEEEISPLPNGYCHLSFTSARKYTTNIGLAHAAIGGGFISGDSYSTMELSSGKHALAISDGMGNGVRAHEESTETLKLLKQILHSGIDEQVAIKSINSILSLRTNDEIYSTLDLAMIDLHHAGVQFLKIGSTPSFIKRGEQVHTIEASNLPIGIIQDFDVDVVDFQLKDEDILIMTSDGVFEGPKHIENPDIWLKRKIKELETNDPQEIADLLLEEVVRTTAGVIEDDMTVLVAKITKFNPRWSSIPVYQKQAN
ncbi:MULTISPECIES: stage II sporulation protein E [Paraliobacillus]|uniref:stage II sporulation protein E n=1 Tax=Paraliobacillus TaxID=200903 RepID=UPI000DD36774|nr:MULTISPECIES: stage II sporulation protein E [Paraliobacillus]